jgi:hypothetical protein
MSRIRALIALFARSGTTTTASSSNSSGDKGD